MVEIKSYIKKDEDFIPVEQFSGPVANRDYIDGAIEMQVNWVTIFDISLWDNLHELWHYFLEALDESLDGTDAEFSFPDQPLRVSILNLWGNKIKIKVHDPDRKRAAVIDKIEFSEAVVEHASHMSRIVRERISADFGIESRLEGIRKKISNIKNGT